MTAYGVDLRWKAMSWRYRVMKNKDCVSGDCVYGIVETYLDSYERIYGWTDHVKPWGDSFIEIVQDLFQMLRATRHDPLDAEGVRKAESLSDPAEYRLHNRAPVSCLEEAVVLVRREDDIFIGRLLTENGFGFSFEASSLNEVEAKATQSVWEDLPLAERKPVRLLFAWETELHPPM